MTKPTKRELIEAFEAIKVIIRSPDETKSNEIIVSGFLYKSEINAIQSALKFAIAAHNPNDKVIKIMRDCENGDLRYTPKEAFKAIIKKIWDEIE